MKKIYQLLFMLVFSLIISGQLIAQNNFANRHYLDPYNPEFVPGEVLIKFNDEMEISLPDKGPATQTGIFAIDKILEDKAVADIQKVFRKSERSKSRPVVHYPDGTEKQVPALYNIFKVKLDESVDILELAENISKEPEVEFAEPNYMFYTMDMEPNDALYQSDDMWHIDAVGAPAAWDSATGAGQVIAILDTGVDWDHPDLDDNIWENTGEIPDNGVDDDGNGYVDDVRGWDYINNDNDPNDDNSHGTHVAGIAAAEGNNEIGVIGIAFEAEIMPLKVLQSSGTGNSSDLAEAIEYAADNGATVINMSLGSYGESLTVKSALEVAYTNSFSVAAAGNDGKCICYDCSTCATMYPAAYTFVLGVMASNQLSIKAGFSNHDPSGPIISTNDDNNYELLAPGVGIISCFPNGAYSLLSGTSMASPVAAGGIGLIQQHQPSLSKEQIFSKLIQSSNQTSINIHNAISHILEPDLYFIKYTLLDTCQWCDNDGAADAGEKIDIFFSVKNAGGFADSVWSKFRLAPYEDTTTAIVLDSTSYFGDISSYAQLTGILDHFEIQIDTDLVNDRDIVFQYEVGCENSSSIISDLLVINTQNGFELTGIMDTTLILTSDKLWLVHNSFKIGFNGILKLNAGAHLILYTDIQNDGEIRLNGTKSDPCTLEGNGSQIQSGDIYGDNAFIKGRIKFRLNNIYLDYCVITDLSYSTTFYDCNLYADHCQFLNCNGNDLEQAGYAKFQYCNFDYMSYSPVFRSNSVTLKHCNLSRNTGYNIFMPLTKEIINYSNFFVQQPIYNAKSAYGWGFYFDTIPNVYWGTTNSDKIDTYIWDFFDDPSLPQICYQPILTQPSDSAHGCVWKVEIDGIDPQDEVLDPLGAGTYQFDVYFNKCMDTAYTPTLSFGVRDPHTQHIVSDNASWSADSTIWTAYYNIGVKTGDGINYIRVADAVDTAGFDIPVEDNERFTFVIQAAAAASVNFIATPGIGKVDLEWPPAGTEDELGYNLYRYQFVDSVNTTDSIRINQELLTDTLYTDFDVSPQETYYYFYKVLGTDMQESDRSKIVSATVDVAPNGDANGDATVNVLDITTIVAYMLNQNPQPFIFDAADVNGDDQINVLDIIGCVQIALGGKSAPLSPFINVHPDPAWISLEDGTISLESIGQVSALQFNLSCENPESVKLFSALDGFEFASAKSGKNTITGILYSFSGKVIPAGTSDIIRIEGAEDIIPTLGEVTGGDANGDYVPILKKGEEHILPEAFSLAAVPNPFSSQTSITFDLPETAMVKAEVMDISGKRVATLTNRMYVPGRHTLTWNTNQAGGLKPGIYLLHFEAGEISKDVKLILMK